MSCAVSVVLPVKGDHYSLIEQSVQSILQQSFRDFELLLINNDLTNSNLNHLLQKIKSDHRDVVKVLNCNKPGISNALNLGIAAASGNYIARMDADDIALEDRLQKQFDFMQLNPDTDMLGMQASYFDENGRRIGRSCKPLKHHVIERYAAYANPLIHPTWFVKKAVFTKIGQYKDMAPAQDYHFICRALRAGMIIRNLPDEGVRYTIQDKSVSRQDIYLTLKLANIIRKSYVRNDDYDVLIDREILKQARRPLFRKLYAARNACVMKSRTTSTGKMTRTLYILSAVVIALCHPLLFIDSLAGFRARKLANE